jgi:hypothetical protein
MAAVPRANLDESLEVGLGKAAAERSKKHVASWADTETARARPKRNAKLPARYRCNRIACLGNSRLLSDKRVAIGAYGRSGRAALKVYERSQVPGQQVPEVLLKDWLKYTASLSP